MHSNIRAMWRVIRLGGEIYFPLNCSRVFFLENTMSQTAG